MNVRRIFLNYCPDDICFETDVFASLACLSGKVDVIEWARVTIPHQINDLPGSQLLEIIGALESEITAHRTELTKRLNVANSINESELYWSHIIDYWLITVVQCLYCADYFIKRLKSSYPDDNLTIYYLSEKNWRFSDTKDFINQTITNDSFFSWLVFELIKSDLSIQWQLVEVGNQKSPVIQKKDKSWMAIVLARTRLAMNLRVEGVYGIGIFGSLVLSILLNSKNSKIKSNRIKPKIFFKKIHDVGRIYSYDLIWGLVPESYKDIKSLPKVWNSYSEGKIRVIGNGYVDSDSLKLAVANANKNGEIIYGCQHGASYGDLSAPATALVEFNLDGFITWGWSKRATFVANYIPLPSPNLGRRFNNKRKTIVLHVGAPVPLIYLRAEGTYSSKKILRYLNNKEKFIRKILSSEKIIDNYLYRAMPINNPSYFDDGEYFKNKFPKIARDCSPFNKSLMNAKIVIVDHPSTVFFQCMAANIPVLGYWEEDFWEMTSDAKHDYQALKDAGIIYDSAEGAACKLMQIESNVKLWWSGEELQNARKFWVNKYALNDRRWFIKWLTFLVKV